MSARPLRIGNVSGYLGDRYTAVDEAIAGDPLDVLMGDYLAEVTLAALAAAAGRGRPGWVGYALDQLAPHLAELARRGTKVVTNAGGFDPAGMAVALRQRVADAGLALRVAQVAGDDVVARLPEFHAGGHALEHLDTGEPIKDWGHQPVAANAYLGGFGIAAALAAGAGSGGSSSLRVDQIGKSVGEYLRAKHVPGPR